MAGKPSVPDESPDRMTDPFSWNPMPHLLDVRCPSCGERARFEFAEVVRIREARDVPSFQENEQFEYMNLVDSCGHKWHAAFYYAGLHGGTTESIKDLPDGYAHTEWRHSAYYVRTQCDIGSVACTICHHRSKHSLSWPRDAYYKIDFRGETRWAFNEEMANELLEYIGSLKRERAEYKYRGSLMKIPAKFLKAGARDEIVRKLGRLLG